MTFGASSASSAAPVIIIVAVVVIAAVLNGLRGNARQSRRNQIWRARMEATAEQHGASGIFYAGVALIGTAQVVYGACAPADIIFLPTYDGRSDVGDAQEPLPIVMSIPRNSVSRLFLDDESITQTHVQTVQRYTVTRFALLGPFSLAAPKRTRLSEVTNIGKFALNIEWKDNGLERRTVLQFINSGDAFEVETLIRNALVRQRPGRSIS